ncbi:hypothetical protein ATO21_07910 [Pediococcus acidilactici]|uniref:hypothetical protein n=1 Tax=Pediococcus acidilactici TaxID=1254 RepID=UPI00071AF9AD|nr:hypothetical protein [Pediococcus acidilactici]KSV55896.1 hypothetical protein ATO21_07910 [Pediococcus acidilactici]
MQPNLPVGLLKFVDDKDYFLSKAVMGAFHLSSIEYFQKNGGEKVKDPYEGIIKLKDDTISYKEIIEKYDNKAQAYITSFTLLYEDDFDTNGTIKKATLEKLCQTNNGEKRPAVIYNYETFIGYMETLISNNNIYYRYNHKYNLGNKIVKDEYDNEVVKDDRKHHTPIYTIYGNKVKYSDEPFRENKPDIIKGVEKSQDSENGVKFVTKYLKRALLIKNSLYSTQNEYRVLVTAFNLIPDEFSESIDLKAPLIPTKLDPSGTPRKNNHKPIGKVIANEVLDKLNKLDFLEI